MNKTSIPSIPNSHLLP